MLRYLKSWIEQLRWLRPKPMEKLARMVLDHLELDLELLPNQGLGAPHWRYDGACERCIL